MNKSVVLAVAVALALGARADSKTAFEGFEKADDMPGAISMIWTGSEILVETSGYADLAKKRPISTNDLFWIASNTKAIACSLLLLQVDRGLVELDKPVAAYLPAWANIKLKDGSAPKRVPTVRDVMGHTSGLAFFPKMPISQWSVTELANMAVTSGLDHAVGEYRYSNWGIDVAMAIVERVVGKPWEVALKEQVLAPLGMNDTTFFPSEKETAARMATTYHLDEKHPEKGPLPQLVDQLTFPYDRPGTKAEAGGGLFSTAGDLMKFFRMVADHGALPNGKVLISEKTMREWYGLSEGSRGRKYTFGMKADVARGQVGHGGAYGTYGEANWKRRTARVLMIQTAMATPRQTARRKQWDAYAAQWLECPTVTVAVDARKPGRVMPNTSQVLTFWNGVMKADRTRIAWPRPEQLKEYPVATFVRYAELMACTGGNPSRDLFKNPSDRKVLDDYDFSPLVATCRSILALGMKPYLKLGNVPAKFSSDYDGGEFMMNIRPPTDHLVHYRYMKACAAALKAAFGREEVRTWRFAVLTEADNTGWYQAKSKVKADTREDFVRLYDYAALAFEEELGAGLVFGSHLLYPGDPNCPQSQFSVEEFVEHCVRGTNRATHKVGAPLRLLTASYYGVPDRDNLSQGRCVNIRRIRKALDKAGLKDVVTGVDEGRVIVSKRGKDKTDLVSRAVGASYQAAFDVRVVKEIIDDEMDYFATWGYFTGPFIHFEGVPSHHYFSSRELARLAGLRRAAVAVEGKMPAHEEMDAIAGISPDGSTVRVVVGRFRDKLAFTNRLETAVRVRVPEAWAGKRVRASVLTLDDRNNWYCDWERDRVRLGVKNTDFSWSPDDFAVMAVRCLVTERYRKIFAEQLQGVYARKAASVRPSVKTLAVSADAKIELPLAFVGNGASYIELGE